MGLDDKIDNKAQEVAGKVKEGAGTATNDPDLDAEGRQDQTAGNQAGRREDQGRLHQLTVMLPIAGTPHGYRRSVSNGRPYSRAASDADTSDRRTRRAPALSGGQPGSVSLFGEEPFAEVGERAGQQPRHVHLGHSDPLGDLALSQVLEEPQARDPAPHRCRSRAGWCSPQPH